MKILPRMEEDGATYVRTITFLCEPKWFIAFVVMKRNKGKAGWRTLKDQRLDVLPNINTDHAQKILVSVLS